jgi:hypothetical protein
VRQTASPLSDARNSNSVKPGNTVIPFNPVYSGTSNTVPVLGFSSTSTCNCTEYIYLNEPAAQSVLKFGFNADPNVVMLDKLNNDAGTMPWYLNSEGPSGLSAPHGIAFDNQGYLYIGETGNSNSHIRRFECGGVIVPESEFRIPDTNTPQTGIKQNLFTIGRCPVQ